MLPSQKEIYINSYEQTITIDLGETWHLLQNRYSAHKHHLLTCVSNAAYWKTFNGEDIFKMENKQVGEYKPVII